MADRISSAAALRIDNTSVLTAISSSVTSVTINGGNELYDNTGLGQSTMSEILGLSPVNEIQIAFKVNSTTWGIFAPCINGTSVTKTVEYSPYSGTYLSGEANVGAVSFSTPIGLQTGSATLRSSSTTGFTRTSVAL